MVYDVALYPTAVVDSPNRTIRRCNNFLPIAGSAFHEEPFHRDAPPLSPRLAVTAEIATASVPLVEMAVTCPLSDASGGGEEAVREEVSQDCRLPPIASPCAAEIGIALIETAAMLRAVRLETIHLRSIEKSPYTGVERGKLLARERSQLRSRQGSGLLRGEFESVPVESCVRTLVAIVDSVGNACNCCWLNELRTAAPSHSI